MCYWCETPYVSSLAGQVKKKKYFECVVDVRNGSFNGFSRIERHRFAKKKKKAPFLEILVAQILKIWRFTNGKIN